MSVGLRIQVLRASAATAGKRPPVKDWHYLGVATQGVFCGLYVGSAPAIHSAHTFKFPSNVEQLMSVSVLRALYPPPAWLALLQGQAHKKMQSWVVLLCLEDDTPIHFSPGRTLLCLSGWSHLDMRRLRCL